MRGATASGDVRTQAQGQFDQAAGFAQDMYNRTAHTAPHTSVTLDKWLRITIETQPYLAADGRPRNWLVLWQVTRATLNARG